MGTLHRRLPDSELEIMLIIWKADAPVTSAYIQEQLRGKKDWVLPTTLGFLSRLVEKGFLQCERQGRNNRYTALVAEREYREAAGRSFFERIYENSLTTLVSSLYSGGAVDRGDLEELRRFIDETDWEEKK